MTVTRVRRGFVRKLTHGCGRTAANIVGEYVANDYAVRVIGRGARRQTRKDDPNGDLLADASILAGLLLICCPDHVAA